MHRRRFLASLAAAQAWLSRTWAAPFPVRFPKPSPYEALAKFIDPGSDEFQCEADAMRTLAGLHEPGTRFYPLADGVIRYETKSPGEYRVGYRKNGKTISETVARAPQPLF